MQILNFLTSHRDTIVILLKSDSEMTSTAIVEEVTVLVQLCSSVLPSVPKSELVRTIRMLNAYPLNTVQSSTVSGLGSVHAAILGLAARCLGSQRWVKELRPQSEAEMKDATTVAPGNTHQFLDACIRTDVIRGTIEIQVRSLHTKQSRSVARSYRHVSRNSKRFHWCVGTVGFCGRFSPVATRRT
jgi:hypothetical protein